MALEKQEILSSIVGDAEPELDIEKGIVKFGEKEFPIQLIGFLDPDEDTWSWAWDNEDIGFPEDLIKEAKAIKEFGQEQNVPQFYENVFSANLAEAHILTMTVSSLFSNDAYCAVNPIHKRVSSPQRRPAVVSRTGGTGRDHGPPVLLPKGHPEALPCHLGGTVLPLPSWR